MMKSSIRPLVHFNSSFIVSYVALTLWDVA